MWKWSDVARGSLLVAVLLLGATDWIGVAGGEAVAMAQPEEGTLTVTASGEPAADVDVFAIINAGKQPLGTTSAVGRLPFDPALLTGKVQVQVAVRECDDRREVYIVDSQDETACDGAERTSEEDEDCRCDEAGVIWWGDDIHVDVVELTASGASGRLTSNPLFWTGLAGGGAAAAIIAATGDTEVTTTAPPGVGTMTTTTTSAPPTTTSSTPIDLSGVYALDVTGVNDPGGHRPFTGDPPGTINVITRDTGNFSATGQPPWVDVHGTIDAMGRFNATGRGTVAGRSNVMVMFEGQIETTSPYRLEGSYRMGTGGELPGGQPIEFLLRGQMQ